MPGFKAPGRTGPSSVVPLRDGVHSEHMSMYVSLLSSALSSWDPDLSDDALLGEVRARRVALRGQTSGIGNSLFPGTWLSALSKEVAYDRALLRLAARQGMDVTPDDFDRPREERERIENQLFRRGVDVAPTPTTRPPRPVSASDRPAGAGGM